MNDPALAEAVKTDLPSAEPNRRKLPALRFAVLVVAVSALGAAYRFTRPPELVWWTSPTPDKEGKRTRALVPTGWEMRISQPRPGRFTVVRYEFYPADRRPALLRSIFPAVRENAWVSISEPVSVAASSKTSRIERGHESGLQVAYRVINSKELKTSWDIAYARTNNSAFNRNYRQICNSLTME